MTVMAKEILELTNNLTEDELAAAKSQLKGNIILAMESTESRMNRLAKGEFYFGRYIPLDEILSSLEAVTIFRASTGCGRNVKSRQLYYSGFRPC